MGLEIRVPKVRQVYIGREGDRIYIAEDNQRVLAMPWGMAIEVARALLAKAREAEEHEQAQAVALDQALLIRAGARIGLTSNPEILKQAAKEAAWNSDLRRYLPGGIRSHEIVGRPIIHG